MGPGTGPAAPFTRRGRRWGAGSGQPEVRAEAGKGFDPAGIVLASTKKFADLLMAEAFRPKVENPPLHWPETLVPLRRTLAGDPGPVDHSLDVFWSSPEAATYLDRVQALLGEGQHASFDWP